MYKKSWDEDHLPEWATESFDYGGTFDATGAFHDSERDRETIPDTVKEKAKFKKEEKKESVAEENEKRDDSSTPTVHHFDGREDSSNVPSKFMDFLNEHETQQISSFPVANHNSNFNGTVQNSSNQIDRMKEVADLVANLIMEDDPKDVKVPVAAPQPPGPQPPILVDWFYLDPQGDTQGPFTAQDMSEWYKAGYFQESLMVRRSIDSAFLPLGQLVKAYGRTSPFLAATLMEPIQAPPPPPPVELDPFRMQQQPQRMGPPPDANGWNMMTPEQQILLMNMRLAHQRPPVPDPFAMKPVVAPNTSTSLDLRRLMGSGVNEFYQQSIPSNSNVAPTQELDPIQQLLMQLQKTGNNGNGLNDSSQWMKPVASQQTMMPPNISGTSLEASQVLSQPQISNPLNQNQSQQNSNWNQAPMSIWDMPKVEQAHLQKMVNLPPSSQNQVQDIATESDLIQNGTAEDSTQFQTAPSRSQESKRKKQKDEEKAVNDQKKQQAKESAASQKPNVPAGKKKGGNDKQQQKKEERSTQPAAPAPWVGHQTPASGTSLAKIQKTEAQRRQGELAAQRERDHQKIEMMQKIESQKNDGLKWASPQPGRVKTLDEIQAEEQTAAAILREREAVDRAKREAIKKESAVVNDMSIWNSTPHSMAWQQPKVWSGEQTSGSGFWEEPTKPSNSTPKTAQMLSKSQTMATITTTKKQAQAPVKKQTQPTRKPVGERKEKKDDNNNEFTTWCTRTLSSMNGNVDGEFKPIINRKYFEFISLTVPTFVSFLQDIESPFEVKDYIKMYLGKLCNSYVLLNPVKYLIRFLGEAKECSEFAKQFLERRSKQRNQQRLQNAHIDDMCQPAPAITPINSGISSDFQEVNIQQIEELKVIEFYYNFQGKNKKVKAKKSMKVLDGRILGFTATSASDRINVGDRDYGDI